MKRRDFIVKAAGASAGLAASAYASPVPVPSLRPPVQELGSTGIKMARMGLGTGIKASKRRSEHTDQGFDDFVNLYRHCYDRGITFFDLADWYGSHVYCREALREIPRDDVTILSKLWWRHDGGKPAEVPAAYRRKSCQVALERFLQELQTDRIDILLLHCLTKAGWGDEMEPYMEVLSEAKAQGKIRALGVSCHDFGAMQTAAKHPWVDVMLARINPFEVRTDASVKEVEDCLRTARANGKGIIGMKIYGQGDLADRLDACMRYAQTCGLLDAMTIGASNAAQVDENLALMAKYPTTDLI